MKVFGVLALHGLLAKDCTLSTETYMDCQERCLLKRGCAYWTWVKTEPENENSTPKLCTFLVEEGWDTVPNHDVV